VVRVVPALAHAQQRQPAGVAALLGGALYFIRLLTRDVAHIVDGPEAVLREGDPDEDAPRDEGGAASGVQHQRQRHLEPQPRALQCAEERAPGHARIHRRVHRDVRRAVLVEERVGHGLEEAALVAEVRRARGLVLVVVAHVVHAAHANHSAQARQRAHHREHGLHGAGGLEATVDQAAMEAHRDAQAHRHREQRRGHRHRAPGEEQPAPHQRTGVQQRPAQHPGLAQPRRIVHGLPLLSRGVIASALPTRKPRESRCLGG
jgi:hypothetical protein